MSKAIKCVNQRFAVKNSGMSCLTSIFDLINLKIKILQVKKQYRDYGITKVAALFPNTGLWRLAATAANLETPCVCAWPSDLPKLYQSPPQRVWPLILQLEPSPFFWNSFWSACQTEVGALPWTNELLSARKLLNKLCGIWNLNYFRSVDNQWQIEASEVTISKLKPQVRMLYVIRYRGTV